MTIEVVLPRLNSYKLFLQQNPAVLVSRGLG